MHHHLEIIMPPSTDIEASLKQIMDQFSENKDDSEDIDGNEFWDFYVAGGRFAGTKETCTYNEDKMKIFYEKLNEKKVTVAGMQFGKQQISPSKQIPMVDGIWNDLFPTENGEIVPCPLFSHSNNQYDGDDLISCDICRVEEIPENLKVSRVIIAGPAYDESKLEATFMMCDSQWNGVNHMDIDWDGKVKSAIDKFISKLGHYKEEYRETHEPKSNWLCITVDYHS